MEPEVFYEFHSHYSFCEGLPAIEEIIEFTKSQGLEYCPLCDTGGFYGLINFLTACRDEGLKPLIATRVQQEGFSALLVARSQEGYGQISELLTRYHREGIAIRQELLKNGPKEFSVVTADSTFFGRPKVYAELNLLHPYGTLREEARAKGTKGILVYPVYFRQEQWESHQLLRAIYLNKKVSALTPEETAPREAHFIALKEIQRRFPALVSEGQETAAFMKEHYFPFRWGEPIIPAMKNAFQQLKKICLENIPKRYKNPGPEVFSRLEKELGIIQRKGFAPYFLIVRDFVKETELTCGRGSAAASIVSYLLFITHVEPIAHDLYFERFLHDERNDPPDIDVDFAWDQRDQILDYIFQKYGASHCAMVANHLTFAVRSSIREVGKVMGLPETELGALKGDIRFYYDRQKDDYANRIESDGSGSYRKRLLAAAEEIQGKVRHMSVHCGGVVITDKPVSAYIPVETAAKGVPVIQLEKDQAEDLGLVKIDVLGNRSLAVVRDTLALVKKHYGISIQYASMEVLEDFNTKMAMAAGETIGVFYVESPAMRQLQKKTGKGDYPHLVIHSSIIRPAANRLITEYIYRLQGKPYDVLLPEMASLLKETYGIMCYQEDITRITVAVAGFSIQEGTELRKVVGNRNRRKRKEELKKKLEERLRERGISEEKINKLWEMIESFSGYSFCKPHSASYALLSFKCCFLKVHYPAEFMGAVLKNGGGFYMPLGYISECRRLGLRIDPPEINNSDKSYFGKGDTLHVGFQAIKGLSRKSIETLTEKRLQGPYKGLQDFLNRTGITWCDARLLILSGAFRNLEPYNRPQLLLQARRFFHTSQGETIFKENIDPLPPLIKDYSLERKIEIEIELYGFILTIHPMKYYNRFIKQRIEKIKDLDKHTGKIVTIAGVLITAKTVLTRHSRLMQFLSFEDETGIVETSLFPEAFDHYYRELEYKAPFLLTGKVDTEFDVINFNILKVEPLNNGNQGAAI